MASKRFIKPTKPEPISIVLQLTSAERDAARQKMYRSEYLYCMAEAKRQHPEWTLKQRQAYANESVWALFD